jgi:hypothetical protein
LSIFIVIRKKFPFIKRHSINKFVIMCYVMFKFNVLRVILGAF